MVLQEARPVRIHGVARGTETAITTFRQTLEYPDGRTEIQIGSGLAGEIESALTPWLHGRTVFLLSTPRVRRLHGSTLGPLERCAARAVRLTVPDGEASKSFANARRLWEQMLVSGGTRSSRLIAFGGGAVGDLGGFVAGCFLRGIEYVQMPTTLLAQIDASIGGKTAIDMPGGKNSVGLFHHPRWVLTDTALLGTLPAAELRSGLLEAVRAAALLDPALLAKIEATLPQLLAGDAAALEPVVSGAAAAKCAVVQRDPDEKDWRRILNFGHTLGHAIEGALGYRHLRHGEVVAYGMLFAMRLAARRWPASRETADFGQRLRKLIERFDIPPLPTLDPDVLASFISRDKKATEAGQVWVLPKSLGQGEMVSDIAPSLVLQELRAFLEGAMAAVTVDRAGAPAGRRSARARLRP
jgi:3-dehydroquinate synthase